MQILPIHRRSQNSSAKDIYYRDVITCGLLAMNYAAIIADDIASIIILAKECMMCESRDLCPSYLSSPISVFVAEYFDGSV